MKLSKGRVCAGPVPKGRSCPLAKALPWAFIPPRSMGSPLLQLLAKQQSNATGLQEKPCYEGKRMIPWLWLQVRSAPSWKPTGSVQGSTWRSQDAQRAPAQQSPLNHHSPGWILPMPPNPAPLLVGQDGHRQTFAHTLISRVLPAGRRHNTSTASSSFLWVSRQSCQDS